MSSLITSAPGILYVVATPLGNLQDITFRAISILKTVDIILAENTRHSKKLLSYYAIETKIISCHEYNEKKRITQIADWLRKGKNIALISDAGTPCISDPGYKLVTSISSLGLEVIPIPGCSSVIAGLSVSGLPTDSFLFIGFLPKRKNQRIKILQNVKHIKSTLIFYESPKRIIKLIEQLQDYFGNRKACLAREISKRYEEYLRSDLFKMTYTLKNRNIIKGECSLFVEGCNKNYPVMSCNADDLEMIIRKRLTQVNYSTSTLSKELSYTFNIPKKDIYNTIINIQDKIDE